VLPCDRLHRPELCNRYNSDNKFDNIIILLLLAWLRPVASLDMRLFVSFVGFFVVGLWVVAFVVALRQVLDVVTFQNDLKEATAAATATATAASKSTTETKTRGDDGRRSSRILPLPADLLKRNASPEEAHRIFPGVPRTIPATDPVATNTKRRRARSKNRKDNNAGSREGEQEECSCRNPNAKYFNCCQRRFGRTHKMGCLMTEHLFDQYKPQIRKITEPSQFQHVSVYDISGRTAGDLDTSSARLGDIDFREILLFRNIYDSLVSGCKCMRILYVIISPRRSRFFSPKTKRRPPYDKINIDLYHLDGRECWKSGTGGPLEYGPGWKANQDWYEHLSFPLDPPRGDRSICRYMSDESERVGMRAYVSSPFVLGMHLMQKKEENKYSPTHTLCFNQYHRQVDWVFNYYYAGILGHWALARLFPQIGERTKTICYEDLGASGRDTVVVGEMLEFWYNGTSYEPWTGKPPGKSDAGGHATTKDRDMRDRLIDTIKEIDKAHYDGDIAWLNSVLPC